MPSHARTSCLQFLVTEWFTPATVLLFSFSLTGLVAGLALVVSATRLLCVQMRFVPASIAIVPESIGVDGLTADLSTGRLFPLLGIFVGLQTASIAALSGYPFMALGALGISTILLSAVVAQSSQPVLLLHRITEVTVKSPVDLSAHEFSVTAAIALGFQAAIVSV